MKGITVRFTDEELKKIAVRSDYAEMNRSDYIRQCIDHTTIEVIGRQKEFYQSLNRIYEEICKIGVQNPKVDLDSIKREVFEACQLISN